MDEPSPSTSKDNDDCENKVESLRRSEGESDLDDEIDNEVEAPNDNRVNREENLEEQNFIEDGEAVPENENINENDLWEMMAAQDNPFIQPPAQMLDFNQLDDALQNVQVTTSAYAMSSDWYYICRATWIV